MKDLCLNYLTKKFHNKNYSDEEIEIIRYGMDSVYILITKTIFIFFVAYLLGIFKEVLLFSLMYNLIRMPSFGLHATKSYICYISSTLIFIIVPYICSIIHINIFLKSLIGVITILLIYKNAPADTYKRPIVSIKRRNIFKFISVVIAIVMVMSSLLIDDLFISNGLLFALIVQCFIISPLVYKLFKLPYNNYKNYLNMA